MNKKEWQKYNNKLLAKGKKSADRESISKLAHKNGANVVMFKAKAPKDVQDNYCKSAKNVQAMVKSIFKGISAYIKKHYKHTQLTLDFCIKLKPQKQGGSTALILYKPTLHLNMGLTKTSKDSKSFIWSSTRWVKDLYVINPAFSADPNPKSKYIYSYKLLDPHTDGYIHGVLDNFMKIPNMQRMINWNDHYYVTRK